MYIRDNIHAMYLIFGCHVYLCIYEYIHFLFKLTRKRFEKSRNILKLFRMSFCQIYIYIYKYIYIYIYIQDISIKDIQS